MLRGHLISLREDPNVGEFKADPNGGLVILSLPEVKAIVKVCLDATYNKQTDIFECEPELLRLAEELGIQ